MQVTVFPMAKDATGFVILVPNTWEALLQCASKKLRIVAKRMFNGHGGEIDSLQLIRDGDVLFVSAGENFEWRQTSTAPTVVALDKRTASLEAEMDKLRTRLEV